MLVRDWVGRNDRWKHMDGSKRSLIRDRYQRFGRNDIFIEIGTKGSVKTVLVSDRIGRKGRWRKIGRK